jgi:hypothetical protein
VVLADVLMLVQDLEKVMEQLVVLAEKVAMVEKVEMVLLV